VERETGNERGAEREVLQVPGRGLSCATTDTECARTGAGFCVGRWAD
jgi:hypothetical protein